MDAVGNPDWYQAMTAQGCLAGEQQQHIAMIHTQLAQLYTSMT